MTTSILVNDLLDKPNRTISKLLNTLSVNGKLYIKVISGQNVEYVVVNLAKAKNRKKALFHAESGALFGYIKLYNASILNIQNMATGYDNVDLISEQYKLGYFYASKGEIINVYSSKEEFNRDCVDSLLKLVKNTLAVLEITPSMVLK